MSQIDCVERNAVFGRCQLPFQHGGRHRNWLGEEWGVPDDPEPLDLASRAGAEQESHRCAGCGHRWEGQLHGAEYCGDCHRIAQKALAGDRPVPQAGETATHQCRRCGFRWQGEWAKYCGDCKDVRGPLEPEAALPRVGDAARLQELVQELEAAAYSEGWSGPPSPSLGHIGQAMDMARQALADLEAQESPQ